MPFDYSHQPVQWTDEQGIDHNATIVSHIRDGATSTVWMAIEKKPDAQTVEWVVKIPLPGQVNDMTDDFEPEEVVVENLRAYYQKDGKQAPIPEMAATWVTGLPSIVMKFFSVENQAILARQKPDFVQRNFARFAQDSVAVFEACVDLGYINTDIKDENFYWYEPGCLLVLDWNRCQRVEKFKDRGASSQQEMIGYVAQVLYLIYTGKDIPGPLPAGVDAPWLDPQPPRALRRLVLDSIQEYGISTFAMLRERVDWLVKTLSWNAGDMANVLAHCKQLQEDRQTPVLARAQSILDLVDSFLGQAVTCEQREELLAHQAWARSRMMAQSIRLDEGCAEIKAALEKVDGQRAIQRCETLLAELDVQAHEKWKLGCWYLIAQCINDLRRQGNLTIIQQGEEKAARIIAFLSPGGTNSQSIATIPPELQACALDTKKRIQIVEDQLQKAEQLSTQFRGSAENQLKLWQEIQTDLNGPLADLPKQVKEIIYIAMPVINEGMLIRQVEREREQERLEGKLQERKQKVKSMLRERSSFAEVYTYLHDQPTLLDPELRALLICIEAAQRGDWPEAVAHAKTQQGRSFDASQQIFAELVAWLQQKADKVLYMADIWKVERVFAMLANFQAPPNSPYHELRGSLQARLAVLTPRDPNSLEWYRACKENRLEPDCLTPNDPTNQPVDWHIERLELGQKQAKLDQTIHEIEESKKRLDSMADLAPINQTVDAAIAQSQRLLRTMGEYNQELEAKRNEIGGGETGLILQVEKLSQELEEVQKRLTSIMNPSVSLSTQVEATRAQFEQVSGFINQLESALAALKNHQEAISGVIDMPTLIHLVVDLSMKKQWQQAQSFVADKLARMDTGSHAAVVLQGWKNNLDGITRNEQIKRQYEAWIDALQQTASQQVRGTSTQADVERARTGARNAMNWLAESQKGLPLFNWLSQAHSDLYKGVRSDDKSARWHELFYKGDVDTVRAEVQEAAKAGMNVETDFWIERLSQFDWAIYLLELQFEETHYGILMRSTIPDQVWALAKGKFSMGYRTKSRGKSK